MLDEGGLNLRIDRLVEVLAGDEDIVRQVAAAGENGEGRIREGLADRVEMTEIEADGSDIATDQGFGRDVAVEDDRLVIRIIVDAGIGQRLGRTECCEVEPTAPKETFLPLRSSSERISPSESTAIWAK